MQVITTWTRYSTLRPVVSLTWPKTFFFFWQCVFCRVWASFFIGLPGLEYVNFIQIWISKRGLLKEGRLPYLNFNVCQPANEIGLFKRVYLKVWKDMFSVSFNGYLQHYSPPYSLKILKKGKKENIFGQTKHLRSTKIYFITSLLIGENHPVCFTLFDSFRLIFELHQLLYWHSNT